jgi:hypothetical protein
MFAELSDWEDRYVYSVVLPSVNHIRLLSFSYALPVADEQASQTRQCSSNLVLPVVLLQHGSSATLGHETFSAESSHVRLPPGPPAEGHKLFTPIQTMEPVPQLGCSSSLQSFLMANNALLLLETVLHIQWLATVTMGLSSVLCGYASSLRISSQILMALRCATFPHPPVSSRSSLGLMRARNP